MQISIIIPVYKAEKYIRDAVESALQQKECEEVVLVEDGSPDRSVDVCLELSHKYNNVMLYRHENNTNRGAGESRNLGVLKAKNDWVSFLDSDDLYLNERFFNTKKIIASHPDIDGVYEPVQSSFENEDASRRFFKSFSSEITMIKRSTKPELLFESLIAGNNGHIHLDGLCVKKEAFLKVGMMPLLRLHQDTGLIFRLSLLCRLIGGDNDSPVAVRRIHKSNRITSTSTDFLKTRYLMFIDLQDWMKEQRDYIQSQRFNLVHARYLYFKYKNLKRDGQFWKSLFYYAIYTAFYKQKLEKIKKMT